MTTTVYGASDDLIEIEGALSEEFGAYSADDEPHYIGFSTGVVLEVRYAEGIWRVRPLAGHSRVTIEFAPEGDEDNYTDRATLTEDPSWVVFGTKWAQ